MGQEPDRDEMPAPEEASVSSCLGEDAAASARHLVAAGFDFRSKPMIGAMNAAIDIIETWEDRDELRYELAIRLFSLFERLRIHGV